MYFSDNLQVALACTFILLLFRASKCLEVQHLRASLTEEVSVLRLGV